MTMLLIYALAVMALNILTGGSGQFSLGQSAFYAVGAYTSAILMEHGNMQLRADAADLRRHLLWLRISCSASRRCGSPASIWRWRPSRWRPRCRNS